MRRPRRNHTAKFKASVALAAIRGDKTLAELSEKYDVHANQIVQRKNQLVDSALDVFMTATEKKAESNGPPPRLRVRRLRRTRGSVDNTSPQVHHLKTSRFCLNQWGHL